MGLALVNVPAFASFFAHFFIDLVAISLVVFFIYFRRHSRWDLSMTYTAFNVGLFVVMTVISTVQAGIGVGFGLFAILSIIRLRSEPFSNVELGYFFIAMVIAVVDALQVSDANLLPANVLFALILNAAAVLVVYVMDHPALQGSVGRRRITLDTIHEEEAALKADLERRLNSEVLDYAVLRVDYVMEVTELDVQHSRRRRPVGGALEVLRAGRSAR